MSAGRNGKSATGYGGSNVLIRVADHDGREVADQGLGIEEFKLFITQELLSQALGTPHGQFLLRLLKSVDYAGAQGRPVLLYGRKQATVRGGFMLHLKVPVPGGAKQGPADMQGMPGVEAS